MVDVGTLIWLSFRPLIKLVLCVGSGFVITKADIFPAIAARGAGQVALNITGPCLMFSKILPAFSTKNIHVLAPLFAIAAIYQTMGMVMALFVKQLFWVPHRFRYGIIAAGGWGNCGDLPTAVVMSLAANSPFKGQEDQDLSVAYISALILFYTFTFFPLGGHNLVKKDFEGPDVEPEEVQSALRQRQTRLIRSFRGIWPCSSAIGADTEKAHAEGSGEEKSAENDAAMAQRQDDSEEPRVHWNEASCPGTPVERPSTRRHVSFFEDGSTAVPTEGPTRPPSIDGEEGSPDLALSHLHKMKVDRQLLSPPPRRSKGLVAWDIVKAFLKSICMPLSLAIIISFPIALITPLKALFLPVAGFNMHPAPDGEPPLAVIYDFAQFMGGASVPLNLVCLGSALARLNVPRSQWSSLPLGAIMSLAVGRMVIMPILGVLICEGLISLDFISKEDRVLQFICIFFSCLPTQTTQVYITQVYSGTGSAEHLSAFLIPQYIIMFLSMTVLSAYALQLIF
ncbi:auxin efflux carrier transmembrane protein [Cylindrobasidium torrendii FP15055 ss-10]|uniref:Auxin efflux carrier transmembrane protein n=1 Tax=Cylindrobasidium torrendii FP15055 ss-10 TaxID=1314674 RepID=A0A0D7BKS6_9AGAR|nr:auxin efflux carrier transmembrane protein [Cylindrobasidium torrendii FP15055 ss-10]